MSTRNLNALFSLWTTPQPDPERAVRAFAEQYTDPVLINGVSMTCAELAERARAQQRAFSEIRIQVLEQIDTPDHTVVAFRHVAKHTGPYVVALGEIAATGRMVERTVIDILRFEGARIRQVRMVADELAGLLQLGALQLARG